ncbi:MAG: hypothetical protein WAN64_00065, partial [Pseudolabrys sp.]
PEKNNYSPSKATPDPIIRNYSLYHGLIVHLPEHRARFNRNTGYFGSIARIMAIRQAMAGCGSKQKCRSPRGMSAFGRKADMAFCGANFRL